MKKYETIFIIKPDQTDEAIQAILDRLSKSIESSQGKLASIEHWGNRRLSYPIHYRGEHLVRGYYVLLAYLGDGRVVDEIERNLKIIDPTFRFLTVKLDGDVAPETVTEISITHAQQQPPEPVTLEEETVEPAVSEPAAEESAASEPAAEEPGASEPAAEESADSEPAAEEPEASGDQASPEVADEASAPEDENKTDSGENDDADQDKE